MDSGIPFDDITARDLAKWTGVNIKTARRWLKADHGVSAGNRKMIEYHANGWIVPEELRDCFRFVGNFAVIGGAYHFSAEDLRGYWLIKQYKGWYERQTRELDQANDYIAYLESVLALAEVVDFPQNAARQSLTAGKAGNPRFNKPKP